ncbi:hypothetical protein BDQ17DRAFT_1357596, partial [Cyathus striatus]
MFYATNMQWWNGAHMISTVRVVDKPLLEDADEASEVIFGRFNKSFIYTEDDFSIAVFCINLR